MTQGLMLAALFFAFPKSELPTPTMNSFFQIPFGRKIWLLLETLIISVSLAPHFSLAKKTKYKFFTPVFSAAFNARQETLTGKGFSDASSNNPKNRIMSIITSGTSKPFNRLRQSLTGRALNSRGYTSSEDGKNRFIRRVYLKTVRVIGVSHVGSLRWFLVTSRKETC